VFKAHGLVYHSTLDLRVIKKKKKEIPSCTLTFIQHFLPTALSPPHLVCTRAPVLWEDVQEYLAHKKQQFDNVTEALVLLCLQGYLAHKKLHPRRVSERREGSELHRLHFCAHHPPPCRQGVEHRHPLVAACSMNGRGGERHGGASLPRPRSPQRPRDPLRHACKRRAGDGRGELSGGDQRSAEGDPWLRR